MFDSYLVHHRRGEVQKQVVRYSCLWVLAEHTVLSPTAGSPGQRRYIAKGTNEMSYTPTARASTADAVDEPIPKPPSAEPSVGVLSTEVLITEQEIVFGTAAAVPMRLENISRRFAAMMRRMFAISHHASRPRPRYYPKRYEFLERALMAREMDRL
jgi:hypothetical protein